MSEEVNELLDKLGSMEDAPLIWINQRVENLITENQQLKDRINKAVEYIKENCSMELGVLCEYGDNLNPKEVVALLKGDK
jgi:hypothetical protein